MPCLEQASPRLKKRLTPEREFWHLLTLAIGGCTVGELQERMGSDEFSDWITLHTYKPFGQTRLDWHFAMLNYYASLPYQKRGTKPKDMLLKFDNQSLGTKLNILKAKAKAIGQHK